MMTKYKRVLAILSLLILQLTLFAQEDSLRYRAYSQYQNQLVEPAITTLKILLEYNKQDVYTISFLATCYLKHGQLSEARYYALKAEKYRKGSGQLVLARVATAVDSFDKAMMHLDALRKSRYHCHYHQLITDDYLLPLTYSETWDRACQNGFFASYEFTFHRILQALDEQKYGEALGWSRDLQIEYPREHYAWFLEALVLQAMDKPGDALKKLEQALGTYGAVAEYQALKVQLCISLQQPAEGLSALRRYRHYAPFDAENLLWEAKLKNLGNDSERALEALAAYLELFPNSHKAQRLQVQLMKDAGKSLAALRSVNSLMREGKPDASLYQLRGELYLETRSYKFAEKDFSMALDLTPRKASLWLQKGNARWLQGDAEGACTDWQWARHYGSKEAVKKILEHCQ